jgi:ABC-type multidrug transport system fused ATPase/permease subunit
MEKSYHLKKKFFIGLMIIMAILAFGALVMLLWNAILPQVIAGVSAISFPQALGILLLSKILFGGFRGRWGGHQRQQQWMAMKEKLANMTPEEREKWKSEWKSRCGTG